jgi:hypothetical protein
MALPIQTIVGGNAPATTGTFPVNLRVENTGGLVTQAVHGDYYESTVRNKVFAGSNLTGVTTSAGFATTHTGCCLSNPIGSTVNLAVRRVKYGGVVAQTAALVFGLQTGYSASVNVTHTTPLVVASNFVGQPAGTGLLDSACTLPVAPTRLILVDTLLTGAITTAIIGGNQYDLQDIIVVPPGGYVATYTSAASVASSLVFGFTWEEVPITI